MKNINFEIFHKDLLHDCFLVNGQSLFGYCIEKSNTEMNHLINRYNSVGRAEDLDSTADALLSTPVTGIRYAMFCVCLGGAISSSSDIRIKKWLAKTVVDEGCISDAIERIYLDCLNHFSQDKALTVTFLTLGIILEMNGNMTPVNISPNLN